MFPRKKGWLLVPILVGLLTIGITAGVALAYGGGEDGESARTSFASRVAAILGLEETPVQEAFAQASEEAHEERQATREARFQERLDQAVADGSITQEQADRYMEWLQSRPEGIRPLLGIRGFRGHGHSVEHAFGGRGFGSRSFGGSLFRQNQGGESRFSQQAPQELFSGIYQTITY